MVTITAQAAVMSAVSNIIAQGLTAYTEKTSFSIDWVPVMQFLIFAIISTPPNILWQEYLEASFPSSGSNPPPPTAPGQAPPLSIRNTLIKTVLDQTVGAAFNTFGFSLFMHAAKMATLSRATFLASASASSPVAKARVDLSRVDWPTVTRRAKAEFWTIVMAGWRFWPFVSLCNFAFVKTIRMRNLVGSIAGLAWGVFMSLFAADK